MRIPRICVAATGGGAGKTMLSLGLGRFWHDQGISVTPFKKGPDYIDAAWLAAACGSAATNLDPWFLSSTRNKDLFLRRMAANPGSVALLEGNRGLYDGLNAAGDCSTAQVARAIECPILLCIDCSKATRTVAAILNGLVNFEDGLHFAGVILNRIGSPRHETALRRAIEANTELAVLGAIPRQQINRLPERHMGLASFGRQLHQDIERILAELAHLIKSCCDTDAILTAARAALPLEAPQKETPARPRGHHEPVIGFARDEALWFYYGENLEALKQAGARLREISLLKCNSGWDNLDGIYLGGGFPEDFCRRLSESPALAKLFRYASDNVPIYAECGGLMVLCRGLELEGVYWPMAGVFDASAQWLPRPQGLGYVEAHVVGENPYFPLGITLRGHEFHYSRLNLAGGDPVFTLSLDRGSGIIQKDQKVLDGLLCRNAFGAYTHIFAPSLPCWAENFVRLAASRQQLTPRA